MDGLDEALVDSARADHLFKLLLRRRVPANVSWNIVSVELDDRIIECIFSSRSGTPVTVCPLLKQGNSLVRLRYQKWTTVPSFDELIGCMMNILERVP